MVLNWLPEPFIVIQLLSMGFGVGIFGLALYGYHRNGSVPLFTLGSGVFALTFLDDVALYVAAIFSGPLAAVLAQRAVSLIGLVLILVAMVLARRT